MSRSPMLMPELSLGKLPKNAVSDETFRVYCRKTNDAIEIAIMDTIGDDGWGGGIAAEEVTSTLRANPSADVTVRINSPGGLAYDGLAIYNALASHSGHVTTINEGLVYSAASIIFMAGDRRKVYEASDFGIHRAHGVAVGNMNQLLAVAELLENIDNHLISIYTAATGNTREQVVNWIDGTSNGDFGSMFSGLEAVEHGFADELIENKTRTTNQNKLAEVAAKQRETMLPLALAARREMIDTLLGRG